MSTEIKQIKGISGRLHLTQFFGGRKNGLSLQLTAVPKTLDPVLGSAYVQYNKQQVRELVATLRNWLAENELPAPVGDGIEETVVGRGAHIKRNLTVALKRAFALVDVDSDLFIELAIIETGIAQLTPADIHK